MKKREKMIAVLCCVALMLSAAACGNNEQPDETPTAPTASTATVSNILEYDFTNMNESAPLGETVTEMSNLQLQEAYAATDNMINNTVPGASIKYVWHEGSLTHHVYYTMARNGSTGVRIESSSDVKAPTSWYILNQDGSVYSINSREQTYQRANMSQTEFSQKNYSNMHICAGLDVIATNTYITGDKVTYAGQTYSRWIQNNSDGSKNYIYADGSNCIKYIIAKDPLGTVGVHQIDVSATADPEIINVPSNYHEVENVVTTTTMETVALEVTTSETHDITAPGGGTTNMFTLGTMDGTSTGSPVMEVVNYSTATTLPTLDTFTPEAPFGEELTDLTNASQNVIITTLLGNQKDILAKPSLMVDGVIAFIRDTTPLYCRYNAFTVADGQQNNYTMDFVLNSSAGRAYKYWDKESSLGFGSWAIETTAGIRTTINKLGEKSEMNIGNSSQIFSDFKAFASYRDISDALQSFTDKSIPKRSIAYAAAVIDNTTYLRAAITYDPVVDKNGKEIEGEQNDLIEYFYYNGNGILTYVVQYSAEKKTLTIASFEYSNAIDASLFDLSTFGGPKVEVEEAIVDTTQPADGQDSAVTTAPADTAPVTVASSSDTTVDAGGYSVSESTTQATDAGGFIVPSTSDTTTTTAATTPAPAVATVGFTPMAASALGINTASATPLNEILGAEAVNNYRACYEFTSNFSNARLNSVLKFTNTVLSGTQIPYTLIVARRNGTDGFYFNVENGVATWYMTLGDANYQLDAVNKTYKTSSINAFTAMTDCLSFISPAKMRVAVQHNCTLNGQSFIRYGLVDDNTGTRYLVYCTPDNLIAYVYSLSKDGTQATITTIESSDVADASYFAIPADYSAQ